jgi:hypothetical protein
MTQKSPKPVKQCEGCLLNRESHCVAFPHPVQQWAKGDCDGYNNEDLLRQYGLVNDGQGAHASKIVRQKEAKDQHDVEHPEDHSQFKKIKFP